MTRTTAQEWLVVRVELLSGRAETFDPPPGRDLLVHPNDYFSDLADAINTAFARWDTSHLREFRFPDGETMTVSGDEWDDDVVAAIDQSLRRGDVFTYIFDGGDSWTHRCTVLRDDFESRQGVRRRTRYHSRPCLRLGFDPRSVRT